MTGDERKAWLAKLKAGDEVAVELRGPSVFAGYHVSRQKVKAHEAGFIWTHERGRPYPVDTGTKAGEFLNDKCLYTLSPLMGCVEEWLQRDELRQRIIEHYKALPIATVRKLLAVLAAAEQDGKGEG